MTDTQSEQVETTDVMPVVEGSEIRLDALRLDGGTQSRDGLDEVTVKEYAATMKENGTHEWPAIKVIFDGQNYWLVDGFHRIEAARRASHRYFKAEIIQGTQRDAVLMSVGVNAIHGLRRTNADKRRAVETLLRDPEWNKWSDREIARLTATSNRFVGNVRNEMTADALEWSYYPPEQRPVNESQIPNAQETRTVQRGGKTFEMKVGGIGADKRGGQGADTWSLIERGVWSFMHGIYYAVDQKRKVIYFAEAIGKGALTAAMCEAKYPGCIAVLGRSLYEDWQQYRAAGYTFKSPDEFPHKQPSKPAPDEASVTDNFPEFALADNYYIVDLAKKVVYQPGFDRPLSAKKYFMAMTHRLVAPFALRRSETYAGFEIVPLASLQKDSSQAAETASAAPVGNDTPVTDVQPVETTPPWYEQSKFRVGMVAPCHKCAKNFEERDAHDAWEPTDTVNLWRCKRCKGRTSDALMKIVAPTLSHLSGERPTNGLTSEAIAKHRQLRGLVHFRMLNKYSRDAGRALQKINFEHGFEAASVAAKGMVSIYNKGAEQLMNASQKKGK